ncbi:Arc family DNA-binding protein [Dokdonella ginsengisoli]|uniref:Arc family DNA-binding protein n=1 Tax=Dokdonella ginsengisoli TaxID=363846 RepID=A0ABV9QUV6_9GAMM
MAAEDDKPAILNLRTTRQVKQELQRQAREQERSMNWLHDRLLQQALGLEGKVA